MKITYYFLCFLALSILACTETASTEKKVEAPPSKTNAKLIEQAEAKGKVPTSININFASGYWHIASGFNVDSLGDFREYDGTWLQMMPNQELIWGRMNDELGRGAWGWNEPKEYLYFLADNSKEFFIGEWKTTNKGDVYVCVGSTPNNPRSTQFKLVRRQSKIVSE